MERSFARRSILIGWIVVAVVTVSLTTCPAFGYFPLAELPWSGPGVILTWILAAFDMPPTVVFLIWTQLGLPSESMESLWLYLLPAMGAILTITPTLVLGTTRIWSSARGRKPFAAYTIGYVVVLIGGGVYTAMEWSSILD